MVVGQEEFNREFEPGKKIVMISNPVEELRTSTPNYDKLVDSLVPLSRMMENCLDVLGTKKPFFVMGEGVAID